MYGTNKVNLLHIYKLSMQTLFVLFFGNICLQVRLDSYLVCNNSLQLFLHMI